MANKQPSTVEVLDIIVDELTYLPTPEQRKAKSAFWARFSDNPVCEPEDITSALAIRFSGDGRVNKWWNHEGFRSWFQNRDEFRQRMEYLANLAMDRLEEILTISARVPGMAGAQIAAGKLIMEVARKTPSKTAAEKFLDESVSKMSKLELEEFIRKRLTLLPTTPST